MIVDFQGRYDLVHASFECRLCGSRNDASAIDLQLHALDEPARRTVRVGDSVELRTDLLDHGYLALKTDAAASKEDISLIETWSCNGCGQAMAWARLEFRHGVLARALAIDLNADELASADFITDQALNLAPLEPATALAELASLSPPALRRELARLEQGRLRAAASP